MGKRDIENATQWARYYIRARINRDNSVQDSDVCMNALDHFIDLDATPAIYGFMAATNLPDRNQVFVSCNKRDMQPYQCDTILADSLAEAWEIAFNHARSFGESSVKINGLIFQLSPFFMIVKGVE